MHAYEIPGLRFSLPAGETIARRRFVNVNSSSAAVIATAAGVAIGVSMDDAASGTPATISDGIVMVDAGAAITAGSQVEVGATGKAVTKAAGIGVGVAITGATGAGQVVAVKLVSVSATDGDDGSDGASTQTIVYTSADLGAGADLADVPIGVILGDGTVSKVSIISLGTAAGIDDDNTSVFALAFGATGAAGATFDATKAFPASGVAAEMTITDADAGEGDVLKLSVTNGATANLPVFMVQVVVTLN